MPRIPDDDPDVPRYLTTGEAALRAGVAPATIRHWLIRGRLPIAARTAGMALVAPEDVDLLVERRRAARRRLP